MSHDMTSSEWCTNGLVVVEVLDLPWNIDSCSYTCLWSSISFSFYHTQLLVDPMLLGLQRICSFVGDLCVVLYREVLNKVQHATQFTAVRHTARRIKTQNSSKLGHYMIFCYDVALLYNLPQTLNIKQSFWLVETVLSACSRNDKLMSPTLITVASTVLVNWEITHIFRISILASFLKIFF